jgi:hypothetical protein
MKIEKLSRFFEKTLRDNCRSVLCNQKLGKYSSMS